MILTHTSDTLQLHSLMKSSCCQAVFLSARELPGSERHDTGVKGRHMVDSY